MCSIAGVITNNPKNILKKKGLILKAMRNRGPDYQDFKVANFGKKKLILFYSRLAINDTSPASSKIFSNKKINLLFNGEIYNYKEIKKKSLKNISHYNTESDTEVLGNLITEKGLKSVFYTDNMFATAIHYKEAKKLFLSIDFYGQKKIFYIKKNNVFYFASEVQLLKKIIGFKVKTNLKSISNYLSFNYKSIFYGNEFHKEIKRLPNNSTLEINEKLNIKKKLNYKTRAKKKYFSNIRSIKETKNSLKLSVKNKVHDKLKTAILLSSGIDSNSIFSLANKYLKKEIYSFSVVSDNNYSEKKIINETLTKDQKKRHTWINFPKKNFLKKLTEIIKYHSMPLSTVSDYMFYFAIKKMKEKKIKILLDGVAGDELFFGYYHHYSMYLNNLQKSYSSKFQREEKNFNSNYPFIRNPLIKNYRNFDHKNLKLFTFNNKNIKQFFNKNYRKIKSPKFKKISNNKIRNYLLNELFYQNIPVCLTHMDLNCAMNSMENRSPFLTTKIFEIFSNTKIVNFISKGTLKYILRESMKEYLPKKIYKRKEKIGLNIDVINLIKNDKRILKFVEQKSKIYKIINKDKIVRLFHDIFKRRVNKFDNETSKFIFSFLSSKVFLDKAS